MNWLKEEARGKRVPLLILICTASALALNILVYLLFSVAKVTVTPPVELDFRVLWLLYIEFAIFAFFEEILFRLPLAIFVDIGWSIKKLLIVSIVLSIIFGFVHDLSIHGVPHIFLQGISGFLYCLLFLKCGGYQKNFRKALITTTITHFLFNAILITYVVLLGVKNV